jgi:peptidoglycan hydrolase-like protein with peptidoglycan-binding domain
MTSRQVKILQAALKTDKDIYPSGLISGFYGELTKEAVINFQEKYNLSPTGEVDQQTADKFNEIYGDKSEDYYLSASTVNTQQNIINNNNDPDPVIDCKFTYIGTLKLRRSVCTRSTDCQINGKWIYYDSVDKCKQDQNSANIQNSQNNNSGNNYTPPNSVSTKIYCSYNGGSDYNFNFGELTYDECKVKTDEYWASKRVAIPTYTYPTNPVPTQPTNDPRCSQAYNMWIEYRNDFLANKMNTYDNSAEAMVVFENEKQYIQNLINSYGCSLTLH